MRLLEQLQTMKQLGISESDAALTERLQRVGYNLERAISDYFEGPAATATHTHTATTTVTHTHTPTATVSGSSRSSTHNVRMEALARKKRPRLMIHSSSPASMSTTGESSSLSLSSSTSHASTRRNVTNSPTCSNSNPVWLVGRRVTLGYTLNAGFALRKTPLRLRFEGVLAQKSSATVPGSSESVSKAISGVASNKKKQKFSAANLMFECEPYPTTRPEEGSIIRGRLSNLICNFLVPLLLNEMIVVTGHIAYDYGKIGVFQDLPLSLQIQVTGHFFDVMGRDIDSVESTREGGKSGAAQLTPSQLKERANLKDVIKAGNELLVWLTEGEDALLASRAADKKLSEYTDTNTSASNDKSTEEGPSGDDYLECSTTERGGVKDNDVKSNVVNSAAVSAAMTVKQAPLVAATQHPMIRGIKMKKYQLQALKWMIDREKDPLCDNQEPAANMIDTRFQQGRKQEVVVLECESDTKDSPTQVTAPPVCWPASLPIEGVLQVPDLSKSLSLDKMPSCGSREDENEDAESQSSLWVPLFGLTILTSSDSLASRAVNYYDSDAIKSVMQRNLESTATEHPVKVMWWNRYTQTVSTAPPPRLSRCRGGILADQMGLGKTIMSIALVVSDFNIEGGDEARSCSLPSSQLFRNRRETVIQEQCSTTGGGTLIVCPMSLMSQWLEEFRSKVTLNMSGYVLRVVMYYGSERDKSRNIDDDVVNGEGTASGNKTMDVVITSYGVLTSEWRRLMASNTGNGKNSSPRAAARGHQVLLGRKWRRVILDEGHTIRNPSTDSAQACHLIEAERRWVLSGTPVQNKIDDLYSLMKFLRHQPWDKWRWWYTTISQPINAVPDSGKTNSKQLSGCRTVGKGTHVMQESNTGISVVRRVLSTLMLRRTKDTIDSETGQCIVSLPPRDVHYVYVDLAPEEHAFYLALAKRSSSQMLGIITRQKQLTGRQGEASGTQSALKGYAELFTLLMRLRQTCDHPVLVLSSLLDKQSMQNLLDGQHKNSCDKGYSDAPSDSIETQAEGKLNRIQKKLLSQNRNVANNAVYLNDVLKSLANSWQGKGDRSSDINNQDVGANSDQDTPFDQQECCVCFEFLASAEETALTPCGHVLCWDCAVLSIERTNSCPICMQVVSREQLIHLGDNDDKGPQESKEICDLDSTVSKGKSSKTSVMKSFLSKKSSNVSKSSRRKIEANDIFGEINWETSSKLRALQVELEGIFSPSSTVDLQAEEQQQRGDSCSLDKTHEYQPYPKVVIFSQWTGMLDLVETMIQSTLVQKTDTCTTAFDEASGNSDSVTSASETQSNLTTSSEAKVSNFFKERSNQKQINQQDEESEKCQFGLRPTCTVRFDGSMSQAQRSQALHRFSTDNNVRILLISLKAGGVGLNLTAASYLFLLDPWWNPAVEDQAIDRVHRLGQKHRVKIMRMVCRNTVEEKLIALQASKRLMSQQAMGSSDGSSTDSNSLGADTGKGNRLSLEELKNLFL